MTPRRDKIDVLSSLGHVKERKLKFPRGELLVVPSLEVLSDANDLLGCHASDGILFLPFELLLGGISVPDDFLDLIGC